VTPLPRGPVQPLVASPTGNILVEKLIGFRDSLYWTGNEAYWLEKNRSKRVSAFQHYFTYDHLGRPATHTQESWASGKLLGTQQWRYEYGENGRLAAKVGKWSKFAFQYGKDGRLSRITAFALLKQQWEMVEETLLTEKSPLKNGSRIITLSTNNKRSGTLENYCTIDYTVAADNAILASTVYRYSYRPCAAPAVYTFAQDQQANPLRDLYLEGRYYQFEFERSSPHSLLSETQNGKSFKATAYRYNEAGNPMYGIVRNSVQQPYRDYTFTYAKIEVPAPPRAAGLAANSAGLLSIYPNPATTSAVISGAGIGPGEATLRIFTTSGQLHRQATYKATGSTLTETISVVGMEKGVYIVEVSGSHAVVKGKLVVE
jgi:hypothetical protein